MKRYTKYLPIALIAAGTYLLHKRTGVSGCRVGAMTDTPVSLDNIRKGIARGWYTAQLTTANGHLAVRLSGQITNGQNYSDVYPVTKATFDALKADGVQFVQ